MSKFTKPPCRDFPLHMWLWLSEELPAAEKNFWQAHLQSCAGCREVLDNAQSVREQYARLPLYEAPEHVIQKIIRRAQPQRRLAGWESLARRCASFFEFRPRLALAGVAFAVLVLGFHYLAFQKPTQPAWEAAAFDTQAAALSSALVKYETPQKDDFGRDEHEAAAEFSWDERATDLRAGIAALESELQDSKL